jgi:hypothetical protein
MGRCSIPLVRTCRTTDSGVTSAANEDVGEESRQHRTMSPRPIVGQPRSRRSHGLGVQVVSHGGCSSARKLGRRRSPDCAWRGAGKVEPDPGTQRTATRGTTDNAGPARRWEHARKQAPRRGIGQWRDGGLGQGEKLLPAEVTMEGSLASWWSTEGGVWHLCRPPSGEPNCPRKTR